ncbi:MAG TPA: trypsin-like peptidase domain-containing protein [Candidatus Nitrosocosmicus sp.]|nr:trypsin-like peptidase domain-containing protein [Candidatus Nitrosocosmicus sp.]
MVKYTKVMEFENKYEVTRKWPSIFFILLLTFIMIITISIFFSGYSVEAQQQSSKKDDSGIVLSYKEESIPDLFDRVKSSVVNISPSSSSENTSETGSGWVYDKNGHIVTNSHVVAAASSVKVTFNDGNQYDAIVVGKDPINDIAVIRISENYTDESLLPVEFGNSSTIRVGERVIAIGNPYGLSNTLTGGFISQTGRLILESESQIPYPHPNMIQTDALINPGNSGGPLFNLKGQLIGMNTATISSEQGGALGLSFSIPSKTLLKEIPVLIENGTYHHPWLGISAISLNEDLNREIGQSSNFKGVLVHSLVEDGPAEEAGVQGRNGSLHGDIITTLDGFPVSNTEELLSYIENNKSPGEKITISTHRNNQANNLTAILGERPISVYTSPYITSQTPLY